MTSHMERARLRNAREDAELAMKRDAKHAPAKPRTKGPMVDTIIVMDVHDGHAKISPRIKTVRDAMQSYRNKFPRNIINPTMRAFYTESTKGWGPPLRDDSFEHFLDLLRAFPDDIRDKYTWAGNTNPRYGNPPNPLYADMHQFIFTDRCGPGVIRALRHVFLHEAHP